MKQAIYRAIIEIAFILFLFYANLLMGEFERSGRGQTMGAAWVVRDVLTESNFLIGLGAGIVGYVVFEYLRRNFRSK